MKPFSMTKTFKAIGLREKILIISTIIVLIVLTYKSYNLDAYTPKLTDDMNAVDNFIEEQYDGFFYESGLIKIRIINYNDETGESKLHLRKYLFGVVPIGDIYTFMD